MALFSTATVNRTAMLHVYVFLFCRNPLQQCLSNCGPRRSAHCFGRTITAKNCIRHL